MTRAEPDDATPNPGWYPNPQGEHRLRFWNGSSWTNEVYAEEDPAQAAAVYRARSASAWITVQIVCDVILFAGGIVMLANRLLVGLLPIVISVSTAIAIPRTVRWLKRRGG